MVGRSYSGLLLVLFALWLGLALVARVANAQQTPPVTVAKAEATQPGVPPAPVAPSDTITWSLALGMLANALMKKLKQSKWMPMIGEGAGWINVVFAGLLAFLTAAGVHTEFDRVTWGFTITGNLLSMLHFVGDWIKQWAIQQWMFNTTKTA